MMTLAIALLALAALVLAFAAWCYIWDAERTLVAAHNQLASRVAALETDRARFDWNVAPPRNSVDL